MLSLKAVTKKFSGLAALSNVSFDVPPSKIKGVIGPNGAGKTTLFNVITGVFPPTGGEVYFEGQEISHLPAERIARIGISRTFQHPRLFNSLTVLENVLLGRHAHTKAEFFACGMRFPWARREERNERERSLGYLDLLGIVDRRDMIAAKLPLGEQRYVEICRALAAEPKAILLDEPTAGLNDLETEEFRDIIFKIRDMGITPLLIEHHMKFIMNVCDEIAVLNFGVKIAEGSPKSIQESPEVIEAYLGMEEEID
jgi:branched-chain amino acid transport system ATP-binding protein